MLGFTGIGQGNVAYILVIIAKLGASITFLVIYLQTAELMPTTIRTTVTGAVSLIAIACSIATPGIMTKVFISTFNSC